MTLNQNAQHHRQPCTIGIDRLWWHRPAWMSPLSLTTMWLLPYWLLGSLFTFAWCRALRHPERLSISLPYSHTLYWSYSSSVASHCQARPKVLCICSHHAGASYGIRWCGWRLVRKFSSHWDWLLADWLRSARTIRRITIAIAMHCWCRSPTVALPCLPGWLCSPLSVLRYANGIDYRETITNQLTTCI